LHFFVFIVGGGLVILFSINVELLNKFWSYFGTTRWSDVFVFVGIIVLFYLYFELLNRTTRQNIFLSKLLTANSIEKWYKKSKQIIKNRKNRDFKDEYIFHIRVYNEETMVWNVIDEILKEWFHKILLINDWSSDKSLEIIKQKQKQNPDKMIIILSHSVNRGWWSANQTWYKFLSKYWNKLQILWGVTLDADWQMDVTDIYRFIEKAKKRPDLDLVLWSRFLKESNSENMPLIRKIILKISQIITILFYRIKISDPHMWFRMIKIENFSKFNITADWMHYANEINETIKKNKMKFDEVPVNITYTDYSLKKWQKNYNWIRIWLEMVYRKLFFR